MSELNINKKVKFQYHILETYEAGISLKGTEVKSCREKNLSLDEGYVDIEEGSFFLVNSRIAPYKNGSYANHEPLRRRRLLLNKREMKKILKEVEVKGMAIVPLKMYLKRGKIKLLIGIAKGKNLRDKREDIKDRDLERATARLLKNR